MISTTPLSTDLRNWRRVRLDYRWRCEPTLRGWRAGRRWASQWCRVYRFPLTED